MYKYHFKHHNAIYAIYYSSQHPATPSCENKQTQIERDIVTMIICTAHLNSTGREDLPFTLLMKNKMDVTSSSTLWWW